MRKWVLSGILASEETYLSHLEALLLVSMGTAVSTNHGINASVAAFILGFLKAS